MADKNELNFCYGCMKPLDPGMTVCPHCGYDNRIRQNEADLLPEGTILQGKYLVGRVMGRGGFGVTYLGYDLSLRVQIAIKEYFPAGLCTRYPNTARVLSLFNSSASDTYEKGLQSFQDEAITLERFDSPFIVHVRDYFRGNGTAYIIMEYIGGIGLLDELENCGGKISWKRTLTLFAPLILEIGKLHEQNLIHRDIKPGNIKILPADKEQPERLVLLDFGSARNFTGQVTHTITTMLTPGYAPPEQYSSRTRQGTFTDV